MKVRITNRQFRLLVENADKGLLIEGKIFLVDFSFGANRTTMMITAHNSSEAMVIARKMFPNAIVGIPTEFKGKRCL